MEASLKSCFFSGSLCAPSDMIIEYLEMQSGLYFILLLSCSLINYTNINKQQLDNVKVDMYNSIY